jgi:hypothetical protein
VATLALRKAASLLPEVMVMVLLPAAGIPRRIAES